MRLVLERIRTWDLRTQTRDSKGSSRKEAFGQLDRLRQKLALPYSVVEKAAYIYRKVQRKKKSRMSRTRAGAMAACVYIACREASVPRTFNEIAEANNVKRREMWDAYRTMVLDLDLKIPSFDPIACLVKLANMTGVSEKTKRLGIDYMRKITSINQHMVKIRWDLPEQSSILQVKIMEIEIRVRDTLQMLEYLM
jgi:transcription initiation factor TFIIB